MNKRVFIIITALAIPVALLAVVMHAGSPNHNVVMGANAIGHQTLDQARNDVKNRLAYLEKLTPAQWPQERAMHPNAPASLADALAWNKSRLAELEKMTPQQWDEQFKPKPIAAKPGSSPLDIIPKPVKTAQKPATPPASAQ